MKSSVKPIILSLLCIGDRVCDAIDRLYHKKTGRASVLQNVVSVWKNEVHKIVGAGYSLDGDYFVFSSRHSVSVSPDYWLNFLFFKFIHVCEYAILYFLTFRATKNPVTAFIIVILYASSDEIHQLFVPTRKGAVRDVKIDCAGSDTCMDFNNKIITKSAQETAKVGASLAQYLERREVPHILCLYGQLGSGKPTFTQGFARGLGITTRLLSPTFIIVRRYQTPK